MNSNLISVFNLSSSNNATISNVNEVNISKLIKIVLVISFMALTLFSSAYIEYITVAVLCLLLQRMYVFFKDLMSIDLHFSNDDIELSDIVNDLWD